MEASSFPLSHNVPSRFLVVGYGGMVPLPHGHKRDRRGLGGYVLYEHVQFGIGSDVDGETLLLVKQVLVRRRYSLRPEPQIGYPAFMTKKKVFQGAGYHKTIACPIEIARRRSKDRLRRIQLNLPHWYDGMPLRVVNNGR